MGVKERLIEFLIHEGISKTEFGRKIGVSSAYVSSIRRSIDKEKVKSIALNFPDLNIDWLLYGDGEMLRSNHPHFIFDVENKDGTQKIPIYDLVATGGLVSVFQDQDAEPANYLSLPGLPPVDGAVYIRGDSMAPLIKSGDIIIYKRVSLSEDSIMWGQIYLLSYTFDQDSYTAVKYLRRSERPGHIRLASENPNFDPQDIPSSSITSLAIVKAIITFHTIE